MKIRYYFFVFVSFIIILYALIFDVTVIFNDNKLESIFDRSDDMVIFPGIKNDFKDVILENLDEEAAGLGLGYLLGVKTELSKGLQTKIKELGLAHIIVVSGTHLAIIIGSLRKIFGNISRRVALLFTISIMVFYIMVVGLTPSLLRAGIVAIISIITWYFGRSLKPWRKILYCLSLCLLFDKTLLFSMGFQMSMLSYTGILVVLPRLIHFFYGNGKVGALPQMLLSTISAIIVMIPIQLYYFGTFSFLGLISNLIILPTIPIAMGLIFATGIFGMFGIGALTFISSRAANLVLGFQINIINFLSDRPEFLIEVPKNNPIYLVIYLVIIVVIIISVIAEKRHRKKRFLEFRNLGTVNIFD